MTRTTDAELVRQALSGAEQAFSELVRRYKHSVYGVVLSFVRDFDTAEDIAKEAFLRAFLHLRTLDEPDRFGNWLRIITANQSRSYLRRRDPVQVGWTESHEAEIHRAGVTCRTTFFLRSVAQRKGITNSEKNTLRLPHWKYWGSLRKTTARP